MRFWQQNFVKFLVCMTFFVPLIGVNAVESRSNGQVTSCDWLLAFNELIAPLLDGSHAHRKSIAQFVEGILKFRIQEISEFKAAKKAYENGSLSQFEYVGLVRKAGNSMTAENLRQLQPALQAAIEQINHMMAILFLADEFTMSDGAVYAGDVALAPLTKFHSRIPKDLGRKVWETLDLAQIRTRLREIKAGTHAVEVSRVIPALFELNTLHYQIQTYAVTGIFEFSGTLSDSALDGAKARLSILYSRKPSLPGENRTRNLIFNGIRILPVPSSYDLTPQQLSALETLGVYVVRLQGLAPQSTHHDTVPDHFSRVRAVRENLI